MNSQILENKKFMRRIKQFTDRIFKTATVEEAEKNGVVPELYEIERRLLERKQIIFHSEFKKVPLR